MPKLRKPSPAMVIALVALFVATSGSAVAGSIVPLAKRALSADNAKHALSADNAKKLATAASNAIVQQAVSQAAQAPGPASTAAGLISVKTATWTNNPASGNDFTVVCDAGSKAIAGGWEDPNGYSHPWDTRPTGDGTGWRVFVTTSSSAPGGQSGTVYAVCLK
jgi:hypothetical protein